MPQMVLTLYPQRRHSNSRTYRAVVSEAPGPAAGPSLTAGLPGLGSVRLLILLRFLVSFVTISALSARSRSSATACGKSRQCFQGQNHRHRIRCFLDKVSSLGFFFKHGMSPFIEHKFKFIGIRQIHPFNILPGASIGATSRPSPARPYEPSGSRSRMLGKARA